MRPKWHNLCCAIALLLLQLAIEVQAQAAASSAWPLACQQLRWVWRAEWLARPPSSTTTFERPPRRLIVHQAWDGRTCQDVDSCSVRLRSLQAYHQHTKGWPDIGYNFLIAGDGTIYEGTGFLRPGSHTLNYNHESLGVALIGTYHQVPMSAPMERALVQLAECARQLGHLQPQWTVHGHRDAACTICPGDQAYARLGALFSSLQESRFKRGPLNGFTCPAASSRRKRRSTREKLDPQQQVAKSAAVAPSEAEVEETRWTVAASGVRRRAAAGSGGSGADLASLRKPPIAAKTKDRQLILIKMDEQQRRPMVYVLSKGRGQPALLLAALPTKTTSSSTTTDQDESARGGQSAQEATDSTSGGDPNDSSESAETEAPSASSTSGRSPGGSLLERLMELTFLSNVTLF